MRRETREPLTVPLLCSLVLVACVPERDHPCDPHVASSKQRDCGVVDRTLLQDQPAVEYCVPKCSPKLCGESDGCGGKCKAGSGCYTPTGNWVTVPPASIKVPVTFQMGSPTAETCRFSQETRHNVTLTNKFEIMATEVTQGQYKAVTGTSPSYFYSCGSTCPVEMVTWHEAVAYCNALSSKAGLTKCYRCTGSGTSIKCQETATSQGKGIYSCPGFRLPTEAEWEYAYRAGTSTAFYNGGITKCSSADANANKIGWHRFNSGVTYTGCYDLSSVGGDKCSGSHPAGQKIPNNWNLYDMAGNVFEWCHDLYQEKLGASAVTDPVGSKAGSYRVIRGGSWYLEPVGMRAAFRNSIFNSTHRSKSFGFRCVRTKK